MFGTKKKKERKITPWWLLFWQVAFSMHDNKVVEYHVSSLTVCVEWDLYFENCVFSVIQLSFKNME